MNRIAIIAALCCIAVFPAEQSGAHTRSESYSHWHLADTSLTAVVTIPLQEVMLLYSDADASIPPKDLFRRHLLDRTSVMAAGEPCPAVNDNNLQAAPGFVRVEISFDCAPRTPENVRFGAMFGVAPAHVNFAKLHRSGTQLSEYLFTDNGTDWNIALADARPATSFLAFLGVGIGHIAGGYDHIAFLLGMLLVAGSLGRTVIAVTGFTLGHSISLAAAVLGYVRADSQLVEAFIGFTVALMAVEYFMMRRAATVRLALACMLIAWLAGIAAVSWGYIAPRSLFAYGGFGVFAACYLYAAQRTASGDARRATLLMFVATGCFGLVHGFGFAGFLMDTGLLGTSLFVPLLGFNVGVEIGQLMLVAVALAAGMLVRGRAPRLLPQLAAAGLCGIGVFWFVGRTLA